MRDPADPDQQRQDADRLRNLLFVPAATVVVAEAERQVIGIGVLSIRPAVRSGPFIGVIDELGVAAAAGRSGSAAPAADAAQLKGLGDSILEHLVTSARNKGCTRVDVTDPLATAEPAQVPVLQVSSPVQKLPSSQVPPLIGVPSHALRSSSQKGA